MSKLIDDPDLVLHFSPSEVGQLLFDKALEQGRLDFLRRQLDAVQFQMVIRTYGDEGQEDTLSLYIRKE